MVKSMPNLSFTEENRRTQNLRGRLWPFLLGTVRGGTLEVLKPASYMHGCLQRFTVMLMFAQGMQAGYHMSRAVKLRTWLAREITHHLLTAYNTPDLHAPHFMHTVRVSIRVFYFAANLDWNIHSAFAWDYKYRLGTKNTIAP